MSMNVLVTIALVVAVGLLYVVLPTFVSAYRGLRGTRLVDCPQTPWPTLITFDVRRSALSAAAGSGRLRVRECTRWPEHRDCGQDCVRHVTPAMAEIRDMLCRRSAGEAG
jgi:hypothetical protein